jgi:probable DNA repair protein
LAALEAGHTVLAPSSELATALFAAVERFHRDAGHGLWPTARVRDLGGWLREEHTRRQLRDPQSTRCLSDFEEQELWRTVVLESPLGADLLEPAGAARAARQARRAMLEYGIAPQALDAYPAQEVRVLSQWIARFEAHCRALNAMSAVELLSRFEAPPEPVAWLESPAWRPVARRWLERHGSAMLRPVACAQPARRWLAGTASPDAELAAAADWARQQLQAESIFRAWICVPDLQSRRAAVIDAFDAALAPARFSLSAADRPVPYAVAGGTPLADYAPVRAALQVLEMAAGSVPFERFSAVLRSSELQGGEADASDAAALDVELRTRAPSEASLQAWLALCDSVRPEPVTAVARLRGACAAFADLRGAQPLSRWIGVWVAAFERAPWADSHRWSSGEYQSAERFRELVGTLAAADPLFGGQSLQSARRILATAARETQFQPQTGVPAIWISGQCMDPWLNYDGLWIAGMSEERWPAPVDPIALLPVRLQCEYGVVAARAESQLALARELQQRWCARAPQCVFSHAVSGDGIAAAPSPVLPAAEPLAPLEDSPRPHWRQQFEAAPRLERIADERAPAFLAGVERTRGVSTLRAQARCAFRGFAETRLRSDPLAKPQPGFNEIERGNLVHAALEHAWATLRTSSALSVLAPAAEDRLLAAGIDRALGAACRRRDPGARWRAREAARLSGLLAEWLHAERLRESFEVERLETGQGQVRHAGVEFALRIDRIDRLADGARVLIDYKTGAATADWRGERPDNPQLPVYALAHRDGLVAAAYGRVSVGGCGFVAETERKGVFKLGGRISNLEGCTSLAQLLDVWSVRVERLAGEFAAGEAQVEPTARACQTCHLHGLCRIATFEDIADDDD